MAIRRWHSWNMTGWQIRRFKLRYWQTGWRNNKKCLFTLPNLNFLPLKIRCGEGSLDLARPFKPQNPFFQQNLMQEPNTENKQNRVGSPCWALQASPINTSKQLYSPLWQCRVCLHCKKLCRRLQLYLAKWKSKLQGGWAHGTRTRGHCFLCNSEWIFSVLHRPKASSVKKVIFWGGGECQGIKWQSISVSLIHLSNEKLPRSLV